MMEVTTGFILFLFGIAGSIACAAILCVMEKNWKKQRLKMLRDIESEE